MRVSRWRWQRRARVRDEMPACRANSCFVIFDLYFPIVIFGDFLIVFDLQIYEKKERNARGIEKNNEIRGVECVSLLRDRLLEGCLELGVRVWIATIAKLKVFL